MTTRLRNHLDLRLLLAPLALMGLLMIAHAAFAFEGDGRLNEAGYIGGDSVYCVDGNHNPTGEPSGMGLKLLNLNGAELFYVSPEQIAAVPHFPAANTLIAQGVGSYGPVYLERLTSGDFQLIGTEDHGKTFFFTWTDCTQVTPIPSSHSGGNNGSSLAAGLKNFCEANLSGQELTDCLNAVDMGAATCKAQHWDLDECLKLFFT